MKTKRDEIFEDAANELGHVFAEISALIDCVHRDDIDGQLLEHLKRMFELYESELIERIGMAERSIRQVRSMVDQWTAVERTRVEVRRL